MSALLLKRCSTASLVLLLLVTLLQLAPAKATAATILVTTTADSGPGSLRQAILDANSTILEDTIVFNIPFTDPGYLPSYYWRIGLLTSLPALNSDAGGIILDGATQSVFSGVSHPDFPPIYIDSDLNPSGLPVFHLFGSYNTIAHLFLANSQGDAFTVVGNHNQINDNRIGTTQAIGINFLSGAQENQAARNSIYGSAIQGIRLTMAHENTITGNIIGLDPDGITIWSNELDGIALYNSNDNLITQNTISANLGSGILVSNGLRNRIESNSIGLSKDLQTARGNGQHGIWLQEGSQNNELFSNWIAGNAWDGIRLSGASTSSNHMEKNVIGMGLLGAAPNAHHGIGIYDGANNNFVGSNTTAERYNFIVNNGWSGVVVVDSDGGNNYILDNFITGNSFYGVHINNSNENKVYMNVISRNGTAAASAGVRVEQSLTGSAVHNTILSNSIYQNSGAGIELVGGANQSISQPHVSAASCSQVTVYSSTGYTVQIFSDQADEGTILEDSVMMPSSDPYNWSGHVTGPYVTITHTDPLGNTSIFSTPLFACSWSYLPAVMK